MFVVVDGLYCIYSSLSQELAFFNSAFFAPSWIGRPHAWGAEDGLRPRRSHLEGADLATICIES